MINEKEVEEVFKKLWPSIEASIKAKIEEGLYYKVEQTSRVAISQTVDQFVRKVAKDKLEEKRKELEEKIQIKVESALNKILGDIPSVLAKEYAQPIFEMFQRISKDLDERSYSIKREIEEVLKK